MKNVVLLVLVIAALFYAQRSCGERTASENPAGTDSLGRGPARDWQAAPNAVIDMQGALGGASGGPAKAARDAVQNQVDR
jgi:hypothetical protein